MAIVVNSSIAAPLVTSNGRGSIHTPRSCSAAIEAASTNRSTSLPTISTDVQPSSSAMAAISARTYSGRHDALLSTPEKFEPTS